MLVITLGSHGSASTWVYNVVIALLQASGRSPLSDHAEDGVTALDNLSTGIEDVVLKAHSMDLRFIKLARMSNAKIITSVRDPLDSAVSINLRFYSSTRNTVSNVSKTFATIWSIPAGIPVFPLIYEDRFMDKLSTIKEIATFLGLGVSYQTLNDIHARFTFAAVQNTLSTLFADAEDHFLDPVTRWYPNHLGDGRTGKWREYLDADTEALYKGCLRPLASYDWQHQPLRWLSELYEDGAAQFEKPAVAFKAPRQPIFSAYGPYLYLPVGRWLATPVISTDASVQILADVYLPGVDQKLAEKVACIDGDGAELAMIFQHDDHSQPIETRLQSISSASAIFEFGGWEMRWLGEVSGPMANADAASGAISFDGQHFTRVPRQTKPGLSGIATVGSYASGAMKRAASILKSVTLRSRSSLNGEQLLYQTIKDDFDRDFYSDNYAHVGLLGLDPIIHYIRVGHDRGYNPCSTFCTRSYLIRYPDVARSGINAFAHYLRFGKAEQRDGSANAWVIANVH